MHGSRSWLVATVRVEERLQDEPVWEGDALVFALMDHPDAKVCYAWETHGQVTALLHTGPINSPLRAVQASILAAPEETR